MPKIRLYNSLSRKKEILKPLGQQVKIYSCGPTVYSEQHIGNMRSMLLADLLIRILEYNTHKVKHIINYTDVGHLTSDSDWGEDKVEKAAIEQNISVKKITKKYIDSFESDIKKLNIQLGKRVKATDHIPQQISLIKSLEKKGYTYKTSDGIYFNTKKFKSYGELSNFKDIKRDPGKRVPLKEKKNPTDFALWKFSSGEKRLQEWESPWGVGFPGWHIECSAMSMKYLGNQFDIHTGGQDLSQVHHNNEIAQSEASTGKKFVNFWLHGGFLLIGGEKAAKSTGNLYTISELEEQNFSPLDLRYLSLQTHYRKPLNFTLDNLDAARSALQRLKRKVIKLHSHEHTSSDQTKKYKTQFLEAINNDLNLPQALKILWNTLEDPNFDTKKKLSLIHEFDKVLGLSLKETKPSKLSVPSEVKKLLDSRERFRKNKLWAESDIIRQRILEHGFIIQDTNKGPRLEKS